MSTITPRGDAERLILAIASTFPCLKKFRVLEPDGSFDPDAYNRRFGGSSTGEYLCGLFILNVWNPSYAKKKRWRFDVFDFLGTADSGNRAAFLNWSSRPLWP